MFSIHNSSFLFYFVYCTSIKQSNKKNVLNCTPKVGHKTFGVQFFMKYSFEEKLNVVSEITCGKTLVSICRERHLDKHQVRGWLSRYRAYGEEGLLKSTKGYHFTSAEKERIILEHIKDGVTLQQLSLRYDVNRNTILSWLRKVRSGGSLYDVKQRGRPPKAPMTRPKKRDPQTELEKLQAENLRLRAENALLKKVKALVEEQKAQARLNGQKPSTN